MINQYLFVWGGKGKLSTSDLCMETVICGIALLGPSWIIDNSIAGGARWQQAFGKVVFELTLMGTTRIHLCGGGFCAYVRGRTRVSHHAV